MGTVYMFGKTARKFYKQIRETCPACGTFADFLDDHGITILADDRDEINKERE